MPEVAFAQSPLGRRLRATLTDPGTSAGNRTIAEFLLRNPVRATAWGIEELAAKAKTSPASLSRFARTLGLKNFAAMRSEMAQGLADLLQPLEKLRDAVGRDSAGALDRGLQSCLDNVRATLQTAQSPTLSEVATRLASARVVYVMGFGLSAHLAGMLSLHLQPYCRQLINVVEFGGNEVAAGRLMNVGEGDVVIALSFPRYASDAVRLLRYARERGAWTVALTDSMAAPLAGAADRSLVAAATHPVLSSSQVAALLLIEALAAALMVADGQAVERAGRLTEAISGYLHPDRAPPRRRP